MFHLIVAPLKFHASLPFRFGCIYLLQYPVSRVISFLTIAQCLLRLLPYIHQRRAWLCSPLSRLHASPAGRHSEPRDRNGRQQDPIGGHSKTHRPLSVECGRGEGSGALTSPSRCQGVFPRSPPPITSSRILFVTALRMTKVSSFTGQLKRILNSLECVHLMKKQAFSHVFIVYFCFISTFHLFAL